VLGPNGAGKSTLLRSIAGLERAHRGEVRFVPEETAPDGSRRVAYAFQENVFLHGTVRDNLELGLGLRRVPPAARSASIEQAMSLLDITHLAERHARQLSGGEARRVNLARALCLRAPVVLLDEPLAGLDGRTYSRLLGEMPRLLRAFAATTVIVTHDRREALQLADDLVILIDGQVKAHGGKHAVFATPSSADVAELLGYTVLVHDGRPLAIPPDNLAPGPGAREFSLEVEGAFDLVDHREVVGRIGTTTVRVRVDADTPIPQAGGHLIVHALRCHPLA
jgi:ABC-type sulfate/molybdate transport systems ATPase subunit